MKDKRPLSEKMKWTLCQKIDHSIGVLEVFLRYAKEQDKEVYISFSGGKDSTVLLDIARRFVDSEIKAVFCNTGNEYPEIVRFVKTFKNVEVITPKERISDVIKNHGFPLISKEQSQFIRQAKTTNSDKLRSTRLNGNKSGRGKISEKYKFLLEEPFMISEKCCEILKKRPFKVYEKKNNSLAIIGEMASESSLRTQQYSRRGGCNSFEAKRPASYPLAIWTDKDIWEYIEKFKISYCNLYDKGYSRTGCMACGFGANRKNDDRFLRLKEEHPTAFKFFMNCKNNGVTYKEALELLGVEFKQQKLKF